MQEFNLEKKNEETQNLDGDTIYKDDSGASVERPNLKEEFKEAGKVFKKLGVSIGTLGLDATRQIKESILTETDRLRKTISGIELDTVTELNDGTIMEIFDNTGDFVDALVTKEDRGVLVNALDKFVVLVNISEKHDEIMADVESRLGLKVKYVVTTDKVGYTRYVMEF